MAVKHEIKSQLAKLLATEDLVVEHRQVQTAQFNVSTRVLTLPLWEKASNTVYDMLVGHEVGHALFTPDQDPPENIPHQFINVVEDARIEKLMKRKYLGLGKTFFGGYKELSDQDFFELDGEDLTKMNLADRANLWFKIGNYINIPIESSEEMDIINMIAETETFADVILTAEVLYKYCKKDKEEKVDDIENHHQQQEGQSEEQSEEQSESSQSSEGGSTSENNENQTKAETSKNSVDLGSNNEPEVHTMDKLDEKLKDLINNSAVDSIYVELPKVNLKTVIASNIDVHKEIDSCFNYQQDKIDRGDYPRNIFENVDDDYRKFKKSAQKEVNYLVKEFECKKAADSYARATTARTGVLDCTKLHTYKYNEDLFRKVTTLADGKNHGLVFVLDWSGSMSQVMKDTCKQLFNLIWFCRKVSIPFEVYAFTNEWNRTYYDYDEQKYVGYTPISHYEKEEGLLCVDDHFTMMNILNSKVSSKVLEHQLINIWRLASYFSSWNCVGYSISDRVGLSGTPLNEALVTLHQILPNFQKENKLQKVQCVILTDGEANHLIRHVEVKRGEESEPYIGVRRLNPENTFVRDRKTGKTYRVDYAWHQFTDLMLTNLKDNFPSVNFIGIRVLAPRDANNFIKLYYDYNDYSEWQKVCQDWKKMKSFCIKKSGYDAYFGLSATTLSQDTEFDVDEGATKAKIKSAFVKSLKTKKLNKKVLGEFISLVA